MKRLLLIFLSFLIAIPAFARPEKIDKKQFDEISDWEEFDYFMKESALDDKRLGWSYIISGVLVTGGGLLGSASSKDTGTQLVLGLSTGLGLAATSYGVVQLLNGNENNSVYESLRRSKMSAAQRSDFVKYYVEQQRERKRVERITGIVTHLLAGGLNLYSASIQDDKNAKSFLHFFAVVNLALAFSYTF